MADTRQTTARDHLRSLSGLAVMEGVRDGTLPHGPITEILGYRVTAVSPGRVEITATAEPVHCNLFGAVHGGWYGTVLDTAMGGAVMTTLPRGRWYTTLEYKINVMRPAPPGTPLTVIGEVLHGGRSTGVARGEIRGGPDDTLYASGSTSCIVMAL